MEYLGDLAEETQQEDEDDKIQAATYAFVESLNDEQVKALVEIVMRPEDKRLRFDIQGWSARTAVSQELFLLIKD